MPDAARSPGNGQADAPNAAAACWDHESLESATRPQREHREILDTSDIRNAPALDSCTSTAPPTDVAAVELTGR